MLTNLWCSTAKCSTFVNHGVSFPYLQTCEERIIRLLLHSSVCFFTMVSKFGNQVIVPLKGSQHLPTQFAHYARNMDSAWLNESFGMQATEAELVPELASASHGLQRINFSPSRIHFLPIDAGIKSFPRCRSSLVFANHTSISHRSYNFSVRYHLQQCILCLWTLHTWFLCLHQIVTWIAHVSRCCQ